MVWRSGDGIGSGYLFEEGVEIGGEHLKHKTLVVADSRVLIHEVIEETHHVGPEGGTGVIGRV